MVERCTPTRSRSPSTNAASSASMRLNWMQLLYVIDEGRRGGRALARAAANASFGCHLGAQEDRASQEWIMLEERNLRLCPPSERIHSWARSILGRLRAAPLRAGDTTRWTAADRENALASKRSGLLLGR